ncbi:hypothetical protein LLEC1_05607 [Akanthomyces lecanii]|uniref:Uncharacterized protein n=1 Tax=Cordyceps confragosa TaxID=2714763 RepID=A0A179ILG0_CORDF|nr:hypothetical protein LLEC1_05607 [Akanthomyces lecanii]
MANTFACGKRASELSDGKCESNNDGRRRESFAGNFITANILQRDATATVAWKWQRGKQASAITAALARRNKECFTVSNLQMPIDAQTDSSQRAVEINAVRFRLPLGVMMEDITKTKTKTKTGRSWKCLSGSEGSKNLRFLAKS